MEDLPMRIERLMVGYAQVEDRVAFDAQISQTYQLRMWMTRVLLVKLIEQLYRLARPKRAEGSQFSTGGEGAEVLCEGKSCHSVLVREIDVTQSGDTLVLVFKGLRTEPAAKLVLNRSALSEWLVQIDRCFDLAQWPRPEWHRALSIPTQADPSCGLTVH